MNKILLCLAALMALSACGEIIDTGNRGIETRFGEVVGEPLPEGFYFYNPFTSSITEIDIKTQKWEGDTDAYTKDVQQAKLHFTINYRPEPSKVGDLFKSVGREYAEKLIPQVITGSIKNVVGKWEAVELVSNRDKATSAIESTAKTVLATNGIDVSRIEITNISFAKEFEKAVEEKVVAVQSAAKAENKTKQIQEEARQKIISAKAEAESMKIRSEALSQNKSLVEYEAVQKWDGKLPVYMLGNSTPFIKVGESK